MIRLQPCDVVQQGRGADDLKISAFCNSDMFSQRQDPQDVVEAVGCVRAAVKRPRLVDGDHGHEVGWPAATGGLSSSLALRIRSHRTPPGRLAMITINDIRTLTATAWAAGTPAIP